MSGGSMNYLYSKLEYGANFNTDTPERRAFAKHLELVAKALHDIEWVDSSDYGPGDDTEAIRACLSNGATLEAAVEAAHEALKALTAELEHACSGQPELARRYMHEGYRANSAGPAGQTGATMTNATHDDHEPNQPAGPGLWALQAREVLELIATPRRPDGTWNRDREACRELAAEALRRCNDSKPSNVGLTGKAGLPDLSGRTQDQKP